ncbi:hypothetical protein K8I31_11210, partial [bacterium]|nr:hypothetical protein [bacterium]
MRDRLGWNYTSSLSRLCLVLLSGLLTILAFPNEGAYTLLSWACMVPWLASLKGAERLERIWLGFLYGTLYIVPGQWGGIWSAISNKDWPFLLSCFLLALFFICYIIPFVIFSFIHPRLSRNNKYSVFKQSMFLTCIISWFPTYFSVTPACMIHDQPVMYHLADIGGLCAVVF